MYYIYTKIYVAQLSKWLSIMCISALSLAALVSFNFKSAEDNPVLCYFRGWSLTRNLDYIS